MFQSVMLAVDVNHTASWEKALPMAAGLVGDGGTLHLLGIVQDLGVGVISSFLPDDFEVRAMEKLKVELAALADQQVPAAVIHEVHVGHGHVPETILRNADTMQADLIVMASHPPDDLRSFFIGSYADKVVHHATRPVLVVR